MSETEQVKRCIDCDSLTTYIYNKKPAWHHPRDGRKGLQCHKCYSRRIQPKPMPPVEKPATIKAKPTLANKFEETKRRVAEARDADALQPICKSFTNFYEAYRRAQRQ